MTGAWSINDFQYPMLLYIINTFFLCFHTFYLYLHTLLTFFKIWSCMYTRTSWSSNCNFRVVSQSGKTAGETRRWECRKDPRRCDECQTLSVYGGHHYQIRTCIPKCVWYLSVILIYDDIINNKSWDRRWGLGRTISRNGMREEEIHVSMCTIYMSRLIKSSGSKYFNY